MNVGCSGSTGVCPWHLTVASPSQSAAVHNPHVGHAVCSWVGCSGSSGPTPSIITTASVALLVISNVPSNVVLSIVNVA